MTGYDIARVRALLNQTVPQVGQLIDVGLGRSSLAVAVVPDAIGTRPWVLRISGDHCRIKNGRGEVVERWHRGPADDAALLSELTGLLFPGQASDLGPSGRSGRSGRVTTVVLPSSSGRGTPRLVARSRTRRRS